MNRFFQRRERTGWRWLMLLVFAVLAAAGILLSVMQGAAPLRRRTSSEVYGSREGERRTNHLEHPPAADLRGFGRG